MTPQNNSASSSTFGPLGRDDIENKLKSCWPPLGLLLLAVFTLPTFAQSAPDPNSSPEGVNAAGYIIHSSTEIGFRFSDVTGSNNMYDTLVNLHQGPRLLNADLSMQSPEHNGLLFDDLFISSFGWGGDPDNVLRARADKSKWYNFQASFRRDQNFFDYDLLANPLNPPTSSPSVPILNSPHEFATTRRMTDTDLTLLPQSSLSFRLGYSRNNMTGPSFSSVHEGTDALLSQPWNTTENSYHIGVDWKFAPRTVVSYDQFLNYFKGDTNEYLFPTFPALLPNGSPVYLGLPIDSGSKTPCAPVGSSLINSSGVLTNVDCNAYFNYTRFQRIRTSLPTERISLRSNYWNRLDLTASYSYSDAFMTTPLNESFDGLTSRSDTRAASTTGNGSAHRISNVADLGFTFHLTQHLRLVDKFYYWAFRIPENGNFTETDSVCTAACTLLTPLSATIPETSTTLTQSSFNQKWLRNQTELDWDITKKAGAHIGYRYSDQKFINFIDFSGTNTDRFNIHEYTALLGAWFRPIQGVRLNFDYEHSNFDNVIVRIEPRRESRYRVQANYSPRPWATIGGSINLLEDSNSNSLTNYVGHNRNYGFNASLNPSPHYGIDLAYNYNDFLQNAIICFNDSNLALPVVANAGSCEANDPSNPLLTNSYYINHNHFGMFDFRVSPIKRVTARLGYSMSSVDGSTPQFNPLQPLGSLNYKYQQPIAAVGVELTHGLTWNTGWNYYQYAEGSFVGPTAPRYFHTNNATLSLRWAF